MSERLEAANYLRSLASSPSLGPIIGNQLEKIAALVESHDDRVVDLLTYNNTMLEENRDQRAQLRAKDREIAALASGLRLMNACINTPETKS